MQLLPAHFDPFALIDDVVPDSWLRRGPSRRAMLVMRRVLRIAGWLGAGVAVACLIALFAGWLLLRGSLPMLEGELALDGLGAAVTVERDGEGLPTIRGESREDIARATGFIHAQDRFFQMDLRRRYAAGELAALFGKAVVPVDRRTRLHRFRARAGSVMEGLEGEDRALLEAYAEGVNAGLEALHVRPFEYLALRTAPVPWRPEDSLLAAWSMFLDLQPSDGRPEQVREAMRAAFSPEVNAFLTANGTAWPARLDGTSTPILPVPGPEHFSYLQHVQVANAPGPPVSADVPFAGWGVRRNSDALSGSNNWVVAGRLTARGGGAIVANDMHLSLRDLPTVWYRARLIQTQEGETTLDVCGITFPGAPMIVAGSNGHVAWGFTNANVDVADVVEVEMADGRPDAYRTPDGLRELERHLETIEASGAAPETMVVEETIWGPILPETPRGASHRKLALAWIAHDASLVNLRSVRLETARTVDEAVSIRDGAWFPAQNLLVGDRAGRIAWTLLGPIPRRVGFDGSVPVSMASGLNRWDGTLSDKPVIADPLDGCLWTANAQTVGGALAAKLGDGGHREDGRAFQIGERLRGRAGSGGAFDEPALFSIQQDNETFFLRRWRDLMLELLDDDAVAGYPERAMLRGLVMGWGGKATRDSTGHRPIRLFRSIVAKRVFARILAPSRTNLVEPDYHDFNYEEPLWLLVSGRHPWTAPSAMDWKTELEGVLDRVIAELEIGAGAPGRRRWGDYNRVDMCHPLARFVPALRPWLGVERAPVDGDSFAPNALLRTHGPSERFVVTPGNEESGIMNMPGGASGHPLSPYFAAGHEAWLQAHAGPFLPTGAKHRLTLSPSTIRR